MNDKKRTYQIYFAAFLFFVALNAFYIWPFMLLNHFYPLYNLRAFPYGIASFGDFIWVVLWFALTFGLIGVCVFWFKLFGIIEKHFTSQDEEQ